MLIEAWLAFVAASVAVVVIPGPTVLLAASIALRYGRGLAPAVTAGVAAGDLVAMTAALAGVGALMQTSEAAFTALKLAGALYLAWIGVKLLRAPAPDWADAAADANMDANADANADADAALASQSPTPGLSPAGAFNRLFLVTALNPKSILFFVALTPQFANAQAPYAPQAAVMIATFVVIGAANALAYALAAERLRTRLTPQSARRTSQFGGAVLIVLAGAAAFSSA